MVKTITVVPGVTCTYYVGGRTDRALARLEADIEVREREERIERELRAWLKTADRSDPEYSDIFKDVYGVRP